MDDDGVLDVDEVEGCTDSTANNYSPDATDDNGTCDYDLDDDGVPDAFDNFSDCDDNGIDNDGDEIPDACDEFTDDKDNDGAPINTKTIAAQILKTIRQSQNIHTIYAEKRLDISN